MKRLLMSLAALTTLVAPAAAEPPRARLAPAPPETLRAATDVLGDLATVPEKGVPPALLADAQGVAIIPRVVKAGFVIAGRGGHGVVLARGKDGAWGEPVFVNLGGASVGFQAGVESADVVLVFRDRKSLDRLLDGKGKVTLGADAAVAAGPVGRQAAAGTDAKLEAEIVSYSRSRGLFAGVALDGAVIRPDADANARFRADARPEVAREAAALKAALDELGRAGSADRPRSEKAAQPPLLSPPVAVPPTRPDRP